MTHGPSRGRVALVAGATGLVGRKLVEQLGACGDYAAVHLLNRRVTGTTSAVIREHPVDFGDLDAVASSVGEVDDAFCCLGTTIGKAGSKSAFRQVDHDYVVAFGRLALSLGARALVVVSSMGANPDSRNFYLRVKGEAERDLQTLGLRALVILRPSLLTGERQEFRPAERIGGAVMSVLSPLMRGPLDRIRPVSDEQVACAMLRAVQGQISGLRILESNDIRATAGAA